jgi:hypothetical protein
MPRKKVKPARRGNWLFFAVVGCLAMIGTAAWQFSFDPTTTSSPAPPLVIAAPPAAVAAVVPSTDVAAVAPLKQSVSATAATAPAAKATPAKAVATKTPAPKKPAATALATNAVPSNTAPPVIRHDPPASYAVERREKAAPPSARVATFRIINDHNRGNFETDDPNGVCVGELAISENELRFEPRDGGDRFAASWADVKDIGGNRFFGSGKGGFHVAVNIGGKYKNFNLAPESKEKAEAKVILDLLNSYVRRSDRTK